MDVKVTEALATIYERDGHLDPAVVVREAANPASPLHEQFEWDDSEAAHQHRLNQARGLIRAVVRVLPQISSEPLRAYISVSTERGPGKGYIALPELLSDDDRYRQALADAVKSLTSLKRRFGFLAELEPLWPIVASIASSAEEKRRLVDG